jgi:hypothetical protein
MKDIIKEIQEEINQLMVSKIAKFSDKQLENWAVNETPYEKVLEMYQLHLSGVSITHVAKQYGYGCSNKVTEKFDRHGLEYKKIHHGKGNSKSIEQYSLDGDYIQTFESVSLAAKYFKCHLSSILGAANGRQKTSCGFIWKYKN